MPRGTLSFNLPDEEEDFDNAKSGHKWKAVVSETDEMFRQKLKYSQLSDETYKVLEDMRKEILDSIMDRGLCL